MYFPVLPKDSSSVALPGFRLLQGKIARKSWIDNDKSKAARKIRRYINNCINVFDVELSAAGENLFDTMIGEILANADDHSDINKWYVYGSLTLHPLEEVSDERPNFNGELNIIFLNFGPSFYKGFADTKDLNSEMFQEMQDIYKHSINSTELKASFPFESMVTLYGLQEGYSRLLHEDQSRGSGTMTYIRSFLDLGLKSKDFVSKLQILSGSTLVTCDGDVKPFMRDNRYFISLNHEEDLSKPPLQKYLRTTTQTFPGTMLLTKAFLDHTHLNSKIND